VRRRLWDHAQTADAVGGVHERFRPRPVERGAAAADVLEVDGDDGLIQIAVRPRE
jgi:hypothetical protein